MPVSRKYSVQSYVPISVTPGSSAAAQWHRTVNELVDPAVRARCVRAARGQEPFDVLITGGTIVDVATGELRRADVGIVGPMIASVHQSGERSDAASVHDVKGCFVAPGFMDLHVHFEVSMLTPARYAEAVCPRGTTTVFADTLSLANVAGLDGVRYAIEASRGLPVRFIVGAAACVPTRPGRELTRIEVRESEARQMLEWPEVGGLGEFCNINGVLDLDSDVGGVLEAGFESGKLVCGHAMGLSGRDLQAYIMAGPGSCHASLTAQEAIDKLRFGMTVEICGLFRDQMLEAFVPALNQLPVFPPNLVTCTDDALAFTLLEDGGIDHLLRRLIRFGLDPIKAIRCATLHSAYRLNRTDLGLRAGTSSRSRNTQRP